MHLPTVISVKWVVVLFLVWVIGTTAAVTILFIHTVLRISPSPPGITYPALNTGCSGLTANVTTVAPGGNGTIRVNCNGDAAFHVGDGSASATPTFSLPTGYTTLRVVAHSATICGSGGITLSSGVIIGPFNSIPPFTSSYGLDYCVDYNNAPTTGLDTFTVTWTD